MTKALWPSALAALVLFAACATTEDESSNTAAANTARAPQARDCNITDQNRALNRDLERANAPGQNVASVVAARHAEIKALADAAGNGARAQEQTPREVACRSIALRAYAALLYSPVQTERDGAWTSIAQHADEGHAACALLAQRGALDGGASADCDLVDMWHVTGPALQAAHALQDVRARPNLEPVSDAAWNEIAGHTRDAASAMRGWANAPATRTTQMRPVVEEHRRRTVCQVFAPLAQMRNLNGRGTPAWQQIYVTDYPAMMASAAAAVPFPPSSINESHAIQTFCGPHSQG